MAAGTSPISSRNNVPLSASSNFPGLRAGSAGKRALLVSEQFALQQIFRNRRAVDLDEGAGGALRMFVNGAGDQIFSDAAFAAQQHRGIGRRDALDQRQHGLHFVAMRDDVGVGVAASQRLAQRAVFFAQAVRIEFLANHQHEFGERKRLCNDNRSRRFSSLRRRIRPCRTPSSLPPAARRSRASRPAEIPGRSFPAGANRSRPDPASSRTRSCRPVSASAAECTRKPSSPSCSSSSRLILASSSTTRIAAFSWRVFM